jgi:hypothetical protein
VLEVNFAAAFQEKGITLDYGVKQGMPGDVDFGWKTEPHYTCIEMKLLGQYKATRDSISAQLEKRQISTIFIDDDTHDVARLQADLIQKGSTRKFNPNPSPGTINLVGVDVTELQVGTVDVCDCLLAAGGNSLAARHFTAAYLRKQVVGVFETIATEKLNDGQKEWISNVQRIAEGTPHPKTYLHGALFLFRKPAERAALSYELRAAIVWNDALIRQETARAMEAAVYEVIPREV